MRKFKHQPTGTTAITCKMVSNHYELSDYKTVTRIPSEFIENSKDWVEIKEETLEDLALRFLNYNFDNSKKSTMNNLTTFFTENKETIHRLSK